jgi:hypothetical protein
MLVRRYPVAAVTAVAALTVSALGWQGRDLPAQLLRVSVFRNGDWFWNPQWFGGHPTLGYSVLLPALGALLGVTLVGVLATTGAVAAFESLVRNRPRATLATSVFAFGMLSNLVVGRLPFGLGAAFALAALATHTRGRTLPIVFAVAASLSSPVAAVFLAIAFAAWAYTNRQYRNGMVLISAALAPAVVTSFLFGTGGTYPYPFTTFLWSFGLCALTALATEDKAVRVGCAMFGAIAFAAFALPTPLGSNVIRMPLFLAAPLVLLADPARTRRVVVCVGAAIPVAGFIQTAQIAEVAAATTVDPSTDRAYYVPLIEYLQAQDEPVRVEIPPTKQHWETAYVAELVPIARGWERQIDRGVNPEFYDPVQPLTADIYRDWLQRTGVTHVALSDALPDPWALTETDIVAAGQPYLKEVWRDAHWRVFAVEGASLVEGPAQLLDLSDTRAALAVTAPGEVVLRVREAPYWNVTSGDACIVPTDDDWLHLHVRRPGTVTLDVRMDVASVVPGNDEAACPAG